MTKKTDDQLSGLDYETIDLILEQAATIGKKDLVEKLALMLYAANPFEHINLVNAYKQAYDDVSNYFDAVKKIEDGEL
jgi:hypothetical protein|tara:strand:+ start:612 stop:845 length:234 start_codon:yes stop_codon:yes gene_type:complete